MAGSEPSPGSRARIVSPIGSCLSRAYDIGATKRRDPSPDFQVPTPDNRISHRHATTIWPDRRRGTASRTARRSARAGRAAARGYRVPRCGRPRRRGSGRPRGSSTVGGRSRSTCGRPAPPPAPAGRRPPTRSPATPSPRRAPRPGTSRAAGARWSAAAADRRRAGSRARRRRCPARRACRRRRRPAGPAATRPTSSSSDGAGRRQGQVRPDRLVEQVAVLRDDADGVLQRSERHVADVGPGQPHRAGVDVVEPGHQRGDGRLARTGGPDQGHHLPGQRGERNPVQHFVTAAVVEHRHLLERGQRHLVGRRVAEADVVELDGHRTVGNRHRAWPSAGSAASGRAPRTPGRN